MALRSLNLVVSWEGVVVSRAPRRQFIKPSSGWELCNGFKGGGERKSSGLELARRCSCQNQRGWMIQVRAWAAPWYTIHISMYKTSAGVWSRSEVDGLLISTPKKGRGRRCPYWCQVNGWSFWAFRGPISFLLRFDCCCHCYSSHLFSLPLRVLKLKYS